MKLELSYIPPTELAAVLPGLRKYLQVSEEWTHGRATAADIVAMLVSGQCQLWVVYEPESKQLYGHFITEIKQYPQCRMLVVQYGSVEPHHMQYVEDDMQEFAHKFAFENGCDGIELMGRIGWRKRLAKYGYTEQSAVFHKYFGR